MVKRPFIINFMLPVPLASLACGGDLLAELAGGHEGAPPERPGSSPKDHLELILADRIGGNLGGEGVDELDDLFSHMIAGAAFAPKRKVWGVKSILGLSRSWSYRWMMCRTLSSWRLYSWRRFTWTSKTASVFSVTPVSRAT